MGKPRLLKPGEAKTSLAMRLGPVVDRARQIEVRLGFRPYEVWLCWTKWSGDERGDGKQVVQCRKPLLPIPKVQDLTALTRTPFSGGRYPVGSILISEISVCYSRELLEGRVLPDDREVEVPEPYDFFWEIVEDGRHGCAPLRRRFQPASEPFLDAENVGWALVLEKQSGDARRDGLFDDDPPADNPSPWTTRQIQGPDDGE